MVDNSRLLLALLLSVAIMVGFHHFYEKPRLEALRAQQVAARVAPTAAPTPESIAAAAQPRAERLQAEARLPIRTPKLAGSLNLTGARFDDLILLQHKDKVGKDGQPIVLLSPSNTAAPHQPWFAEWGWLAEGGMAVPTASTRWQTTDSELTPNQPITLRWNNGQGLVFVRTIAVDDQYMFTVTERVENQSSAAVRLFPFGLVNRQGESPDQSMGIIHIGLAGVFEGRLRESNYSQTRDEGTQTFTSTGGWLGVVDKYWLVALIPAETNPYTVQFRHQPVAGLAPKDGRYQVDYRAEAVSVPAAGSYEKTMRIFAGAKEVRVLDDYRDRYNITDFDKAIDFGWFYFLTKPFLLLLDWLLGLVGNAGVAILILTVMVKLLVLPLALKSFQSMARLKELQPEVQKIMERHKEDQMARSVAVMELYKREKVSPFSGCVPILFQLPVFFALYKVLMVGIELRHAPFFGWIQDMSAPDPTSLFNLFGLLPYAVPQFLHVGVWPILMGISMWLQQKMAPTPPDKIQQQIFMFLPIIFTFMLGPSMAAGLIIYWTWSNLLSVGQQWAIGKYMPKPKAKR